MLQDLSTPNVDNFVHVGGLVGGFLLGIYCLPKIYPRGLYPANEDPPKSTGQKVALMLILVFFIGGLFIFYAYREPVRIPDPGDPEYEEYVREWEEAQNQDHKKDVESSLETETRNEDRDEIR